MPSCQRRHATCITISAFHVQVVWTRGRGISTGGSTSKRHIILRSSLSTISPAIHSPSFRSSIRFTNTHPHHHEAPTHPHRGPLHCRRRRRPLLGLKGRRQHRAVLPHGWHGRLLLPRGLGGRRPRRPAARAGALAPQARGGADAGPAQGAAGQAARQAGAAAEGADQVEVRLGQVQEGL